MANFEPLLKQLEKKGIRPNSPAAREWFFKKVRTSILGRLFSRQPGRKKLLSASERARAVPTVGRMYCYSYNPKYKNELPYYDEFPLIFCIGTYGGGFLGINLHYVSPTYRMVIMDSLSKITNNKSYNETTKLAVTYQTLKGLSKFGVIKPTVKRYLYSQVRSRFVHINADEWDIAIFLPVANFKKASQSKVWSDSLREAN